MRFCMAAMRVPMRVPRTAAPCPAPVRLAYARPPTHPDSTRPPCHRGARTTTSVHPEVIVSPDVHVYIEFSKKKLLHIYISRGQAVYGGRGGGGRDGMGRLIALLSAPCGHGGRWSRSGHVGGLVWGHWIGHWHGGRVWSPCMESARFVGAG
jgi:hypothetical protein